VDFGFNISTERTGVCDIGNTGNREGFSFTNLSGAHGSYELVIKTKMNETPEIIYNYK
jgi:hypothetical protein